MHYAKCLIFVSLFNSLLTIFHPPHNSTSPLSPPVLQLDPAIIGGMVVDLGDKFIDMSTQTKITKIVKTLSETL